MTDFLREKLARELVDRFDESKVVVWQDESGILGPLLQDLLPAGVTMPEFRGNPLSLRSQMDAEDPELRRKWLLYVPRLPDGVDCGWLRDYERGFTYFRGRTLSWALSEYCGLKESPEVREALMAPNAAALALKFDHYFEPEPRALSAEDVYWALLQAAVTAPRADEIDLVLRYLTSEDDVDRWRNLKLLPVLSAAITGRLGLGRRHLVSGHPPPEATLCRCMVASALVETDAADAKQLANYLPQEGNRARWRGALERGLNDPRIQPRLLATIDHALHGSDLLTTATDPMRLANGPALPAVDRRIEQLLLQAQPADEKQLATWWSDITAVAAQRSKVQQLATDTLTRWRALEAAADLLGRVARRTTDLASYPVAAFDRLVADYLEPHNGDWKIDARYRSLPQVEGQVGPDWDEKLIRPARSSYHRWTRSLTERTTHAVEKQGNYALPGVLPHTSFHSEMVEGTPGAAVLFVDAMRADLAYRLRDIILHRGYKVETRPALAQLPTRTEVGMAALLPGARGQFAVRVEDGKLISYIGPTRLPSLTERTRHFAAATHGRKVENQEIDQFLRNDAELLSRCIAEGSIAVARTTEVDDSGGIAAKITFDVFRQALEKCADFVDRALQSGFPHVVIGTDHGFLVRDPEAAPGGVPGTASAAGTLGKGRRYVAGTGAISAKLLPLSAEMLGRDGDPVYVPYDTSLNSMPGGGGLFVHGGLSLQECALVFMLVTPQEGVQRKRPVRVSLRIPEQVTGLTFKISLSSDAASAPLLLDPREVRVDLRDEKGRVIKGDKRLFHPTAQSETHEPVLKVPRPGRYEVSLVDTATGNAIQSATVRVDVLGDSFDF